MQGFIWSFADLLNGFTGLNFKSSYNLPYPTLTPPYSPPGRSAGTRPWLSRLCCHDSWSQPCWGPPRPGIGCLSQVGIALGDGRLPAARRNSIKALQQPKQPTLRASSPTQPTPRASSPTPKRRIRIHYQINALTVFQITLIIIKLIPSWMIYI